MLKSSYAPRNIQVVKFDTFIVYSTFWSKYYRNAKFDVWKNKETHVYTLKGQPLLCWKQIWVAVLGATTTQEIQDQSVVLLVALECILSEKSMLWRYSPDI